MNYRVKQGKVIYHADQKYIEGQEVELTAAEALIHAENIEVILLKDDFDKIDKIIDIAESDTNVQ